MRITRRDLLAWGGGLTTGMLATPVPWKIMDDSAKWTQNWPWIPQPARGPVEWKPSFCTLCPRGCGMRVRLAGGWPAGIAGMPHHPLTHGALCPFGFGAHQLNWHPRRLRQILHRGRTSSWNEALAAFRKACAEGPIAVVDGWGRRAASAIFQEFALRQGGAYRTLPTAEERTLEPYADWSGVAATTLGYDLENARTILTFNAPLLDGWGTPGRFERLWSERAAGQTDPELRVIQVDSSLTRTANCAWRWIPVSDGSEAALACGLARVLLEDHLVETRGPMPPMTLAQSADRTGLSVDAIRELARILVERGPVLVIAADNVPAVAALNLLLRTVGARGGIIRRTYRRTARATEGARGPFRAVLVDSSVPWDFALPGAGETFRFAAWNLPADQADWLLPAPGIFEQTTDIPTAPDSQCETYAVAPRLAPPPAEVRSTAEFLRQADDRLSAVEGVIRARCRELFQSRAGNLLRDESTPVSRFESAGKIEEALRNGAIWIGGPPRPGGLRCDLQEWPAAVNPPGARAWTAAWVPPVLPPLATKLYRDSSLREPPEREQI